MNALTARYFFSSITPPARDVTIRFDNRLREVTAGANPHESLAIVPGLFNAHTHLELSGFSTPLGNPAAGFPAWIREVIAWRRAQSPEQALAARRDAVAQGLAESRESGVTTLYDIASPGWNSAWYDVEPSRCTLFQEVLGLSTARSDELFAQARSATNSAHRRVGLSPHAPYTVGVELLSKLATLGVPLAMHLAESADELELLRSHSGAFYALLTELEAWDPAAIPRGIRILDYLRLLAAAPEALVIHGNYLDDAEQDFLASQPQMTVVYCPRTHAYFDHARYPLCELLARGVRVRLGTDSRASNPDLNLWNDLRYVADVYPELSLDAILALGVEAPLAIGAPASFAVVAIPEEDATDPYELLFDARSRVVAVYK